MTVLEQETPRKLYVKPKIEEVTLSLQETVLGSNGPSSVDDDWLSMFES
jgi:hypothetical protein